MARVAVVGAGGYLGGRLVAHLRDAGTVTIPVSRQAPPWLGDGTAVVDLLHDPPAALDRALEGATAVVHVAGHDEVIAAREPERGLVETITMTQRVADAARRVGTPRVVYVSTVHVYGARLQPGATITEDVVPEPRAPYALARLTSEHLLAGVLDRTSELVTLRLTNAVGAPVAPDVDRWTLLVNDLSRQAVLDGQLVLHTPGLQRRDWVDLGDVCRAIAAAAELDRVPPGTYNLGSGTTASVREIAELVAAASERALGTRPPVVAPATDEAPPVPYRVDVGRLAALDLRLDTPISASIEEVVRFCAANRRALGEDR
jgi:UDP-glucose 4-epimerase